MYIVYVLLCNAYAMEIDFGRLQLLYTYELRNILQAIHYCRTAYVPRMVHNTFLVPVLHPSFFVLTIAMTLKPTVLPGPSMCCGQKLEKTLQVIVGILKHLQSVNEF